MSDDDDDQLSLSPIDNDAETEPQIEAGGAGNGNKIPLGTNASDDDDDYVGYRHPPRKHRFKPGESGNPKGRRKSARGLKTLLREELSEKAQITERGRTRSVSKLQLMIKRLSEKGAKGDLKAIGKLIEYGGLVYGLEDDEDTSRALTANEQEIIQDLERRQREAEQFLRRNAGDGGEHGEPND
jgi:hypothetical protein